MYKKSEAHCSKKKYNAFSCFVHFAFLLFLWCLKAKKTDEFKAGLATGTSTAAICEILLEHSLLDHGHPRSYLCDWANLLSLCPIGRSEFGGLRFASPFPFVSLLPPFESKRISRRRFEALPLAVLFLTRPSHRLKTQDATNHIASCDLR